MIKYNTDLKFPRIAMIPTVPIFTSWTGILYEKSNKELINLMH